MPKKQISPKIYEPERSLKNNMNRKAKIDKIANIPYLITFMLTYVPSIIIYLFIERYVFNELADV